jgi:hypothetical protein
VSEIRLDFDLLTRTALDHEQLRDDVRDVDGVRRSAPLERGALGRILPAEEIYAEFDQATAATEQNLADLMASLDGMAERLRLCRELFVGTDRAIADGFDRMRG